MKILVIDDDGYVARAIQRRLMGHVVAIEMNSKNVVSFVENVDREDTPFDAVICDFKMPGTAELLAVLRSRPELPMLILMSGYDNVVEAARVADAVLLKPFGTSDILETIERIKVDRSRTTTRRLCRSSALIELRRSA